MSPHGEVIVSPRRSYSWELGHHEKSVNLHDKQDLHLELIAALQLALAGFFYIFILVGFWSTLSSGMQSQDSTQRDIAIPIFARNLEGQSGVPVGVTAAGNPFTAPHLPVVTPRINGFQDHMIHDELFMDDEESWNIFEFDDLHSTSSPFDGPTHDLLPSAQLIHPVDWNVSFATGGAFALPSRSPPRNHVDDKALRDHTSPLQYQTIGQNATGHADSFESSIADETAWAYPSNTTYQMPWNPCHYTTPLYQQPRHERIPSLETDLSAGSISFESQPDDTLIFGASHWRGMNSLGSIYEQEDYSVAETFPFSIEKHPDTHSWDVIAECGSIPDVLANLENSGVRIPTDLALEQSSLDNQRTNLVPELASNSIEERQLPSQSPSSPEQWTPTSTDTWSSDHHYATEYEIELPHQYSPEKPRLNVDPFAFPRLTPVPEAQVFKTTYQEQSPNYESMWNCFVQEDGSGRLTISSPPHRKGTRRGPLLPEQAESTAKIRRAGTTCLRCRAARTKCDGRNPCSRCIRLGESSTVSQPCIKANFLDIVKSGTLNYISQRVINHFTLDESHRIKLILPETFDINHLLHLLETRRNMFNLRARQASGSLYVLDLRECYKFLNNVRQNTRGATNGCLRHFIDNTLVKTEPWYACVDECDPKVNPTLLLSQWNNMPSRASYDLVPLNEDFQGRPLDPEDEEDQKEIIIAAQLSRIVCRKLEIDGYKALQAEINGMRTTNSTFESRLSAVEKLGKILLSLRWRISWWKLLGDGSNTNDPFRNKFVERVDHLAKVLYFYFFTLKTKVGSYNNLTSLDGEISSYPDSTPIFQDFPTVNSIEAFEDWMERGQVLIKEANVERRFSQ